MYDHANNTVAVR